MRRPSQRSYTGILTLLTLLALLTMGLLIGQWIWEGLVVKHAKDSKLEHKILPLFSEIDQCNAKCHHYCTEYADSHPLPPFPTPPPHSSSPPHGHEHEHEHENDFNSEENRYKIVYNKCLTRCQGTDVNGITLNFKLSNDDYGNPTAIRFGRLPWDHPLLPQRMFVAQQDGRISYTEQNEHKGGPKTTFLDLSSLISTTLNHHATYTEAGLLGFELHPYFQLNGKFFVWYSIPRAGGNNATNTPNCSAYGGYGSSGPSNDRRNFGTDRTYNPTVYSDLTVLEEYVMPHPAHHHTTTTAILVRRILTVKHMFTNHYSINNLYFEENGQLLVFIGDGGCYLDQFGLAQNREFLAGKIISIQVDLPPPLSLYNCTTPVLTWNELSTSCFPILNSFTLYSTGCMNGGHFSIDRHGGKINRYVAQVGDSNFESIYKFDLESNFGWVKREGKTCTCLSGDPIIDTQCDFTQTISQCISPAPNTGYYDFPQSTMNHRVDHASAEVGGFVYRGHELPCSLYGSYIHGDWAYNNNTHFNVILLSQESSGFKRTERIDGEGHEEEEEHDHHHHPTHGRRGHFHPQQYIGKLRLSHFTPSDVEKNTNEKRPQFAHGRIHAGKGLKHDSNYLSTMGYDKETNRIYIGVQSIIPPYHNGHPSNLGEVYLLTI